MNEGRREGPVWEEQSVSRFILLYCFCDCRLLLVHREVGVALLMENGASALRGRCTGVRVLLDRANPASFAVGESALGHKKRKIGARQHCSAVE